MFLNTQLVVLSRSLFSAHPFNIVFNDIVSTIVMINSASTITALNAIPTQDVFRGLRGSNSF
jgi:hypothetical protein